MKLKIFTILFISVFALSSCEKIKNLEKIKVKDIEIPVSTEISMPLAGIEGKRVETLQDLNLNINVKDKVDNLDQLKEAKLKSFKIKKESLGVPTLKVIREADIYVSSTGFPAQKIAFVKDNTNPDEITFQVIENVDLVNFIKQENKTLTIKNVLIGETSTTITKVPLIIELDWSVTVEFAI